MGSEKKPVNLLIDTGSSLTWLPGSDCFHSEKLMGDKKIMEKCMDDGLDITKSDTFLPFLPS